jgi:DNA-binding MarR family transcriptional regulator
MRIQKIPFTQVANRVIDNPSLSLKAKGLFAYLFSKPESWQFSCKRMPQELQETEKTIRGILKELEAHKYLERKRLSNGKMEYTLRYTEPRGKNCPRKKLPL